MQMLKYIQLYMHCEKIEAEDFVLIKLRLYIDCLHLNNSRILPTIFTNCIFTDKLCELQSINLDTQQLLPAEITASRYSWPSPRAIMRLTYDSQFCCGHRSIVLFESQRIHVKFEGLTRDHSTEETRFDEANEPNQTKSRTITLKYDTPFYRSYYQRASIGLGPLED